MHSNHRPHDEAYDGRALVATFPDRDTAHDALHLLHAEGFRRTWLGVTQAASEQGADDGGTRVRSDDEGPLGALGRFLRAGDARATSLHDELLRHGVDVATARRLDGALPPRSCVLTVDGANHPELAAQVIERSGGHLIAGESFGGYDADAAGREYARGSEALGYQDPLAYARGTAIDGERRAQLRAERLDTVRDAIDRQDPAGMATVREEFFDERRPAQMLPDDDPDLLERDAIRIPHVGDGIPITRRMTVR